MPLTLVPAVAVARVFFRIASRRVVLMPRLEAIRLPHKPHLALAAGPRNPLEGEHVLRMAEPCVTIHISDDDRIAKSEPGQKDHGHGCTYLAVSLR